MMENKGTIAIHSYDEMLDRFIGAEGSPERKQFEAEVEAAVEQYNLGQAIKEARMSKNLTQEELGELVGVKRSQICRWEKGRSVAISTLHKVFQAMNMSVSLKTDIGIYPIG